jgi:hypothetical protein
MCGPLYCLIDYVPKLWLTSGVVSAFLYVPKLQHATCNPPISFFQFFGYFAVIGSSLLIVFRMYVFHALPSSSRIKALKEAWQNRYLEHGHDCYCYHNWHMCDGYHICYRW